MEQLVVPLQRSGISMPRLAFAYPLHGIEPCPAVQHKTRKIPIILHLGEYPVTVAFTKGSYLAE